MTEETHASADYEARLEAVETGPLKAAGRWVVALASATLGDGEFEANEPQVVVHSRVDDSVLLRIRTSSLEEAERLIVQIREDLETMSAEEFKDEWEAAGDKR
ncbi:hypothetical protein [Glutamicibacter sp.]|uniref:hypothetical protein n=1 Tax=Glutamicibacter sp. TaxID=1931995 RepID=UPI0028BDEB8E|nr:hypothetical protein [Glutamicibacter sp.]